LVPVAAYWQPPAQVPAKSFELGIPRIKSEGGVVTGSSQNKVGSGGEPCGLLSVILDSAAVG
jgi:hypothetical protein